MTSNTSETPRAPVSFAMRASRRKPEVLMDWTFALSAQAVASLVNQKKAVSPANQASSCAKQVASRLARPGNTLILCCQSPPASAVRPNVLLAMGPAAARAALKKIKSLTLKASA